MRNKKWLKSITAVAMSIVLLVTTVPIVLAVDTTPYNPSPTFSDAAREQGAAAWLSEDGSVWVEFPAAEGALTYQGYKNNTDEKKNIVAYVLELYDLGGNLTAHDITAKEPLPITVDAAGTPVSYAGGSIRAQFSKTEIDGWGGVDLTNRRYSVKITAVDEDGWLSQEMYTYVSNVPIFSLTDEEMMPMSAHLNAMREMMCFEASKTDAQSSDGTTRHDPNASNTTSIRVDYEEEGGTVSIKGKAEQAGAINAAADITTDTSAYRILITGKPGANGQTVDTGWSRQTYDYTGAKEIWFWLDLSQVDMKGISFRLRSNEKQWRDYGGQDTSGVELDKYEADDYGTVYSTVGAAVSGGKNPYVYVQQEDGSWKTVDMTNGTIDLAHFKGYVRIPIEFFCSETNTYVQLTNDGMGKRPEYYDGRNVNKTEVNNWANTFYLRNADGSIANVLVDEAGKPISEAVLVQRRGSHFHKAIKLINPWYNISWMKAGLQESENKNTDAYMIAPARGTEEIDGVDYETTCSDVEMVDGAYTVVRRENSYKAIQDVMSAGFAYTSISDDSVNKSVYLDNVMFYRDDGGQFPPNKLNDNDSSTGVPVTNYFNQKEAIQEAIFNTIDEYITNPNYSDYRAVKYIANLINNYKRVYTEAGQYAATDGFLEYVKDISAANYGAGALMETAAKLGKAATWQKYLDARKACLNEGTIQLVTDSEGNVSVKNVNNSDVNDLVPNMIRLMEKLPDPETVTQVSDTLRNEIVKLYRIYTRLNLGQLTLLGTEEEKKLIAYFNLVVNAIQGGFVTGRQLANMPFITFNNFEENTNIGERAYQLENDPNIGGDADFRRTKGIVTYSIDNGANFTAIGNGIYYNPNPQNRPNATWAYITNKGFKNSKGATVTIDADFTGGTETGTWHTITVSKKSAPAANLDDRVNNHSMTAENLGGMAAENKDKLVEMDQTDVMPISLVFYVDFSELSNFKFGVNVFSKKQDGTHIKVRPDMGTNITAQDSWRTYFMLDTATGEWKRVQNDNQWSYSSNSTNGDGTSLDGYKGYIAIPLQHFKRDKSFDINDRENKTAQLDYDTAVLQNIYAIQFGIAGDASINNATFTIDNIGFTYDKAKYDSLGLTTGQPVTTYAEKFGAKSDEAEDFEEAVAKIDPYANEAALANAITEAENKYNALPAYQKTLPSVQQDYELLTSYKDGTFLADPNNQPSTMTVDELVTAINALPTDAKNASTTANDLPYPGYTAEGSVDYSKYGFADRAAAEKAIELYEKNYKRMSKTATDTIDLAVITDLLNAYGAARRCLSLEAMKTDVSGTDGFLTSLAGVYNQHTKDEAQTKYVSIATRDTVNTEWERIYNSNMLYYAKAQLAAGLMGDGLKPYQSVNSGVPRFLGNTRAEAFNVGVTLSNGTTSTQGGVIELQKKYTAVYNMAKDKITAQALFTADELQQISDAIGEYDSLLQAYHDVTELYNVIADIKALFPVHNISLDKDTVTYTADNWNVPQTATYSVAYSESMPIPSDAELNKIKITAANGTLTNVLNETADYEVIVTINGTPATYTGAQLLAGVTLDTAVKNNSVAQDITLQLNFPSKPTAANIVSDTLTIQLLDKDGNVVQSRSGAVDEATGWNALEDVPSKTVTFNYSQGDTYTITIPAEVSVPWNSADAQKVGYKVETSLATGSSIAVSVADDGTNTLKADGYSYTLPFTPENFAAKPFTGTNSKDMATEADCPKLTISGWESVPIGEYRTTLTYTVDYTKGTATP